MRKGPQSLRKRLRGYVKVKTAILCLRHRRAEHTHRADNRETGCASHPLRPNDHSNPLYYSLRVRKVRAHNEYRRRLFENAPTDPLRKRQHAPRMGGAPRASAVRQTCRTIGTFVRAHGKIGGDRAHESVNVAGMENATDA
jgi:hypothetical protein